MSFLNATTPEALREAVRLSAAAQAGADQVQAECTEARNLAPVENDFLRDDLALVVHRALTNMDESHGYEGTAPVLTVAPYGYAPMSRENTRDESAPVSQSVAAGTCHKCANAVANTVPFWLALGRHILQIDLCPPCAIDAIDRGARPQSLTIPATIPAEFS